MIALAFVCFYTWRKLQIVAFLITGLALMILEKSLVYEQSLGVVSLAEALVYNFCLVIGFVALTMTLMYISNLQNMLMLVNRQNERLLNRMHEGTLILDKITRRADNDTNKVDTPVLFINDAACKILKKFLPVAVKRD